MGDRKVVVITGASAGVGRATARAFAKCGFDVALLARGQAGLEAAAKEVIDAGARALVIPVDVSRFADMDAAASQVEAELGPIGVSVNNAMTTVLAPSWDMRPADFQRAVEVTFLGQVWGTFAALARMRPSRPGHDRQCRLGPGLCGHSSAGCLLFVQVRLSGVLRIDTGGTPARW